MNNQTSLGGLTYVGGQGQLQLDINNAFQLLQDTESLSPQWRQDTNARGLVRVEWKSQLVDILVLVIGEYLNVEQLHFVRGRPPPSPLHRMVLQVPPVSPYPTQVTVNVVFDEGLHYDCLEPF